MQVVTQQVSHYSGPLPPADELARYEEASPGFAMAILKMAQEEQQHAMQLERAEMQFRRDAFKDNVRLEMKRGGYFGRGQIAATIMGVLGIVGGCVVAGRGEASAGVAIVTAVVTLLGVVMVWGKWHDEQAGKVADDKP